MSNLATLNNTQLAIPSDVMQRILAMQNDVSKSFGTGFCSLTFKGREFHITKGDTKISVPTRHLDVVIVAVKQNDHRIFFKSGYQDNEKQVPTCWSSDGKVPDENVPANQRGSNKCEGCPFDEKHSGQNGVGRACTRKRRVVLAIPSYSQEGEMFVTDISAKSIYAPKNPSTGQLSLKQWLANFKMLSKQFPNLMTFNLVTQLSFAQESVPVVQFSFFDMVNNLRDYRVTDEATVQTCIEAWTDGTVEGHLENSISVAVDTEEAISRPQAPKAQVMQPMTPPASQVPPQTQQTDDLVAL